MITYTRTENITLTLRSLAHSCMKGRSNRKLKNPPKKVVAIYLTKNIGDMIFATPVFHALKKQYPEVHLTVIGSAKNKIILENSPDIDVYAVCPDSADELIETIRKVNADYGFNSS